MLDAATYQARQTEKQWQRTVVATAEALGWTAVHLPGWPDLILLRDGRVLFVELKREGGKLTRQQERWQEIFTRQRIAHDVWRPSDYDRMVKILGGTEVE
jgi:hypothetical protein